MVASDPMKKVNRPNPSWPDRLNAVECVGCGVCGVKVSEQPILTKTSVKQ